MSGLRKFLVIADESEECRAAAYFAAKRAHATGARVALLSVIEPSDFEHWLGVGETMRREASENAERTLDSLAEDVEAVTGERPDLLMREGETLPCLRKLIEDDDTVALLVLGASSSGDGPGPLVTSLARGRGLYGERPIPVTVVPGDLSRESIDALA